MKFQSQLKQKKKPVRRRIIRRRGAGASKNGHNSNSIPDRITQNQDLLKAISALPKAYEFEILKTLWRIEQTQTQNKATQQPDITHVALQMPEGLLLYACTIADIVQRFSPTVQTVSIMGDVTYGACCVDDLGAQALGADLLVHYGHSCLIPVTHTVIPCLYVFVEITVDVIHLVDCFCETFPNNASVEVEVMGTVQFRLAVTQAAMILKERGYRSHIPQAKPLSPGEVLGCTAPGNLADIVLDPAPTEETSQQDSTSIHRQKVMLFIADGRFHLEAAMIANPSLAAFRYDPYSKKLTMESYETDKMKKIRHSSIMKAKSAQTFGIILGTLGRQGNPAILSHVRQLLRSSKKTYFVILLSEILPQKLRLLSKNVDAWVQIACPRLSIDWGHFFEQPILSPYELEVCLNKEDWRDVYPMDFYSNGKTNDKKNKHLERKVGRWSNYHEDNKLRELSA